MSTYVYLSSIIHARVGARTPVPYIYNTHVHVREPFYVL